MRYLASFLRVFVLVAVVLAIANFSDVKKVRAGSCDILAKGGAYDGLTNVSIPADCDGKVVTIDGAGYVDPTPPHKDNPLGALHEHNKTDNYFTVLTDETHSYANLTIKNKAILTHNPLVRGDDISTADNITLTPNGQKKRVDLNISGTLTLASGGKIDVTGKGYPGAYFSRGDDGVDNKGCDGDHIGHLVGGDGISAIGDGGEDVGNPDQRENRGFGPGGGTAYNQYDYSTAGGGSFGGLGGPATYQSGSAIPIISSTYNYLREGRLQPGSGGGAASHKGRVFDSPSIDVVCTNGGAGGGIIRLNVGTLNLSNAGSQGNDLIIANGAPGYLIAENDSNKVGSGGGSGGVIRLSVTTIRNDSNPSSAQASVAPGLNPGTDGQIKNTTAWKLTDLKGISARGGDRSPYNLPNSGAGGGGGWIVIGPEEVVPPPGSYCGDGTCDSNETPETCPEDCGDPSPIPALATDLIANPPTGQNPLTTYLGALPTGGDLNETTSYSFWWNCNQSTTTYAETANLCGNLENGIVNENGFKINDRPAGTTSQATPNHTYTTDTTAKVIVERGLQSATDTVFIDVTDPTLRIESKRVEVTVSWNDGQDRSVKLYDILRNAVPTTP